jgi:invasion protein IalB
MASPRITSRLVRPLAAIAAAGLAGAPGVVLSADESQIVQSPWTNFCGKDGSYPGANETCITVKEARRIDRKFMGGAALIERTGSPIRLMRITLPGCTRHDVRVIVDRGPPRFGRYLTCLPNGCMTEFEVDVELMATLKSGQTLTLQGTDSAGVTSRITLPLAGFVEANGGPPTQPKMFEEDVRKLPEDLQKRAEEARKRVERYEPPPRHDVPACL